MPNLDIGAGHADRVACARVDRASGSCLRWRAIACGSLPSPACIIFAVAASAAAVSSTIAVPVSAAITAYASSTVAITITASISTFGGRLFPACEKGSGG